MKRCKYIIGLLTACILFSLTACSSPAETKSEELQPSETSETEVSESVDDALTDGSGVIVAYFSATGNTRSVAESIADITGGELYEIVPSEPYTAEDLDYGNSQSRSSLEMGDPSSRPEIGSAELSLDDCSTLYLGYPIWHGQAPRIMDTFVETYDFDGITVIPFCTSGGSGVGSSAENLAALAGSGNWLEGQRFSANVSDTDIYNWLNGSVNNMEQ